MRNLLFVDINDDRAYLRRGLQVKLGAKHAICVAMALSELEKSVSQTLPVTPLVARDS